MNLFSFSNQVLVTSKPCHAFFCISTLKTILSQVVLIDRFDRFSHRTSFILRGLTGKLRPPVSSPYFFSRLLRFSFSCKKTPPETKEKLQSANETRPVPPSSWCFCISHPLQHHLKVVLLLQKALLLLLGLLDDLCGLFLQSKHLLLQEERKEKLWQTPNDFAQCVKKEKHNGCWSLKKKLITRRPNDHFIFMFLLKLSSISLLPWHPDFIIISLNTNKAFWAALN